MEIQIIHYELKHDRYIVFRFLRTSELRKRRLEFLDFIVDVQNCDLPI